MRKSIAGTLLGTIIGLLFMLSVFGIVCSAFSSSPVVAWSTQIVDVSKDSGFKYSVAVDSQNNPHIAYENMYDDFLGLHGNLTYASFNGVVWVAEVIPVNGSATDVSLAFDSNDRPHIAFFGAELYSGAPLRYASWTGTTWTVETVDSTPFGNGCSLVIDSNNNSHISYYVTSGFLSTSVCLKYAINEGSGWQVQAIPNSANITGDNSIAIDSNGNPHIVYSTNDGNLKYTSYNGSAWCTETVYTSQREMGYFCPSLAIDCGDMSQISFLEHQNRTLNYACGDGASWTIEKVSDLNDLSSMCPLAVDSEGIPHIVYGEYSGALSHKNMISYASRTDSDWAIHLLNGENDPVFDVSFNLPMSFVLDSKGIPHICFKDLTSTGWALTYATNPSLKSTPSSTLKPTATPTETPITSAIPSLTPSLTPNPIPVTTPSPSQVSTATPIPTQSATPSPSPMQTSPTITPTPTVAMTPTATPTETSNLNPSPLVPELPGLAMLPLFIAITVTMLVFVKKKGAIKNH